MAETFNGNVANYTQKAISFSAGKGTVMAWVRIATDRNDYSTFFQCNNVDNQQFVLQTGADGTTLSCYIYNNTVTGSNLTAAVWYHLTLTWDGTSARVYVNGVLDITNTATGSTWNEICLGKSWWGEPLNGNIADVMAWDDTLSAAQIQQQMYRKVPITPVNLKLWMPTFDGAGERNADYSGAGNSLTVTGTITDYPNPPVSWGAPVWVVPFAAAVVSDNTAIVGDSGAGIDTVAVLKSPYYVNHATASSGPGVTSLTVSVPSGTADGDLMLAVIVIELSSGTATPPAGWNQLWNATNSTRSHTQIVYARIASSEPANYSWTWSSAECAAAIITYRNAAYPVQYSGQFNNASQTNAPAPSLTTASPNSLSVYFGSNAYGTTWTAPTSPGTYNERIDIRSSTASTNLSLTVADYNVVDAGTASAPSGTAANADYNAGGQVILAPAARTLVIVDTAAGFDAATAAESSGDQTITVTDSGSGTDALASVAVVLSLTDSGAGNDAFGAAAALAATDTGTGSDSIAQLLASLLLAESGAGADALAGMTVALSATDSGTGSDAIAGLAASLTAVDAGTGTDALGSLAASLGITDVGSGADALASLAAGLSVTETGAGTDALASIAAGLTVTDSGVGADTPSISVTLSVTDSGAGVDTVLQMILIAIADAGTAVDSLASITVALTLLDSGAGSEALSVQVAVSVTDAGSGTDALNLLTEALKQVLDSGAGTDLVLSPAVSLTVLDSGTGVDDAAVSVTLTVTDSGSAVEALDIIATMLVSILDSGAGSDALAVSVAPIVVADSGVGDDTPGIAVALTLADAGSGSDALLTSVLLTVADAAAGTDAVGSITVNVVVTDIGEAVDVLGQIDAVLSVLDLGEGIDVVVRFDSAVRLVKVVFTLARRTIAFAWLVRSVVFSWSVRTIEFAGPAPSIEFGWSRRATEFALNS